MSQATERQRFLARYGAIFEHSCWVAEEAFDQGLVRPGASGADIHQAMCEVIRALPEARLLALINTHPDLAGKLALAGEMTDDSHSEQSSAGLDRLTADELARFTALNDAYKARFGFVFIMAVRDKTKADILAAFERRLQHDRQAEFATALEEIFKITRMRIDRLGADEERP